jgi:signal transduction histidine kinase
MTVSRHLANASSALRSRSIAQRLLLHIIIFSSFVTLIATSVQLFTDYQRDVGVINSRLNDIESGYLASISASLWNIDIKQLELLMDGIKHLPDIQLVEIHERTDQFSNPLYLTRGEATSGRRLSREFPIIHSVGEEARRIGTLSVHASLNDVYKRLWEKAVLIFLSQGIKTFLVSLFTLYIFYHLVTRHLSEIAHFVKNIEVEKIQDKLRLQRKQREKNDELDDVVTAFNAMTLKLFQTYEKLRIANQNLEDDIVARKKAEQEVIHLNRVLEHRVKQRTAELEAANKELGSFCYSVSHDLRAPLRRIEGFRRMLNEGYGEQVDDKGRHYLTRIEAGTREMSDMINSFLRLSRATQGEMNIEHYNISILAEKILARLLDQEPERTVNITIQTDVYAEVDKKFFEVLLTNLFENAWKYSLKNRVTDIQFGMLPETDQRVYYIRDNGVGFDMAYADRLFSPFSRLHNIEEFEGAGIGLATVQRIIARHGGRIWAESAPGQGATFYFTLWSRNSDSGHGNHFVG